MSSNIAISHYLCPDNISFVDFLNIVDGNGYEAIGLTLRSLRELPLNRIISEVRARDMKISSINSAGFFIEDGYLSGKQKDDNLFLLNAAEEIGEGVLNIIPGGSGVDNRLDKSRSLAKSETEKFVLLANKKSVVTVLEPFYPTACFEKNCVNTISQALSWVSDIEGLKLNVDLYHTWWDPDINKLLSGEFAIGLFQVCGVMFDKKHGTSHRASLNNPDFKLSRYISDMRRAYPDIHTEVELFANQLPDDSVIQIIEQSAQLIKHKELTNE